jgi:integrase
MGVYERVPGSGQWSARWSENGKIQRKACGMKSVAIEYARRKRVEAREGKLFPERAAARARNKVRFAQLVDDAMDYVRTHKKDQRTAIARLTRLRDAFGERPALQITPNEIAAWLAEHTHTPATYNRYRAAMSLAYRQGAKSDLVDVNPARRVEQRKEPKGRQRYLEVSEERTILEVMRKRFPRYEPHYTFAVNTGLRQGMQFTMDWTQVNMRQAEVIWADSKNGDGQIVRLNSAALAALKQLGPKKRGPVWLDDKGEPMLLPRDWWERVCAEAQVEDVNWHTLRHTYISRMVMAGVDLVTVSRLAGHKTYAMTLRYSHLSPHHESNAAEAIVGFRDPVPRRHGDTNRDTAIRSRSRARV